MSDWTFRRRLAACAVCTRAFGDGERHFSALSLASDLLRRDDVCATCFEAALAAARRACEGGEPEGAAAQARSSREGPRVELILAREASHAEHASAHATAEGAGELLRASPLFWWRTRHEAVQKRALAFNLDAIQNLFLGLEGRAERRLRELRYVLCLLLLRKRLLKVDRILRDEEGESMLVHRPRRKEELRVFVYDFDAARMAELRDELRRLFDAEDDVLAGLSARPSEDAEPELDGGGGAEDGDPEASPEASLERSSASAASHAR